MTDKLKQSLKDAGQSVTGPRMGVFEFIARHDPTTVADLIEQHKHTMDRASIYRTLSLFRDLGIIQDIVAGGRRMIELTDGFDIHHHHVSCTQCGSIKTIEDAAIERRLDAIARMNGFEPSSHQIEVSGICQNCRAATSGGGASR